MGSSRTLAVSLLLLLPWAHISLIGASENGSMSTVNPGLVYSTDFANVTKQDTHHLNMGQIADYFAFGGDGGGASMWMEGLDRNTPGITCHSGSRCVGMELTNITKSRRAEFNIENLENLVGNELYVSVWLYLPSNWNLHSPDGNNWYEIVNPYFTGDPSNLPYTAIQIFQTSPTSTFDMDLVQRDISSNLTHLQNVANYPLPRGQWFNVQYYVRRDVTNGAVKVWLNDALLFDVENIQTVNPSIPSWFTTPAKIYYDPTDTYSPYLIWADDLEIYSALPQTSIPGFPWESILVGVIMGLGTLVVMRCRKNWLPRNPSLFRSTLSSQGKCETRIRNSLQGNNISRSVEAAVQHFAC